MIIRIFKIFTLVLFSIQVQAQVPEATGTGTPDNTMNWIISRRFNALGAVSDETKLFYDTRGSLLQSQSKVFNARADADPAKKVHVLASQPIYDNLGRAVITTLQAPINSKGFSYQPSFANYTHQNFDGIKTYNPDPVPVGSTGTLGWYYSDNNTWEKYTPKTSYPYSRVNYYKDGTNTIKRIAAEGDYHKMGMNHEEASYSVAVINELDHYLQVRNKYFASAGELPASLKFKAIQNIFKDPNGVVSVNMVDKDGHVLMSGKPGSLHTVNNSVALTSYVYGHTFTNASPDYPVSRLQLKGTGNGKIYVNGSLVYTGSFNNYTYPSTIPQNATVNLVSDKPFYSSYCLQVPIFFFVIDWPISTNFPSGEVADANAIHYFYLFASSQVSVSGGNFSIFNMDPDENAVVSQAAPYSGTLPAGYYKLIATSGDVTLNYSNSYDDLVYDFNNQIGQGIASITAEGVKKIITQGLAAFATLNDVPFAYKYEYDMKGQVVTENDPDRGVFKSVYKKNGYVRFTQNNDQLANGGKYSYINYDKKNRVIEIGEFNPNAGGPAFNSAAMLAILENPGSSDGLTGGVKTGVMKTTYDYADNTHIFYSGGNFQQDYGYLRSQISTTENDNMKTWFGYNEHGMVSFTIRWIKELGNDGYKTIEYQYDKAGNLVKVTYQRLTAAESFVHQYVYDEDQRVKEVYTTTNAALGFDPNNPAWKLQARYQYYLHGPLKREELAGNLQGIDYTYTVQGWLKAINHPNQVNDPGGDGQNGSTAFVKDAFGMSLEYFSGDYQKANTNIASLNIPLGNIGTYYEGTVKGVSFFSKKTGSMPPGSDAPASFAYQYDNDYQFSESFYGTPDFNTNNYVQPGGSLNNKWKERATGYDQNGNILGLVRHDAAGNLSENFASYGYQTNTNKLSNVPNYASFSYNTIGQVTSIASVTGVTKYVAYDSYGGVLSVANNSPGAPPFVSFLYDEGGDRIAKKTSSVSTYYVYDNSGEVLAVYSKTGAGSAVLQEQMVYGTHRVGTYYRQAGSYLYELQDNTGSVRAVIGQAPIAGNLPDVTQFNDFYPYGTAAQSGGTGYRYDYQGLYSEKDPETGWNSFDIRQLDAKIGRWLSADPAGQYVSPYISMGNNPLLRVDPSGGEDTVPGRPRAVWEDYWVYPGTNIIREKELDMVTVSNKKEAKTGWLSSVFHTVLDFAADYIPIPAVRIAASLLNAGLYAIEGNTGEAISSLAGIIPGGKKLVNGVQYAQQFYNKAKKWGNGLHKVYQGYDKAGNVKYVGRTIMPMKIRAMAHRLDPRKKDLVFNTRIKGLSLDKARKWEQTLINVNGGLQKNNPTSKLLNKINSIKESDWGSKGVVQQVIVDGNRRL